MQFASFVYSSLSVACICEASMFQRLSLILVGLTVHVPSTCIIREYFGCAAQPLQPPIQPAPHARLEPAAPAFKNELRKPVLTSFTLVPSLNPPPPPTVLAFMILTNLIGKTLHELLSLFPWPSHIGSIGDDLHSVKKQIFVELAASTIFPLYPTAITEFVSATTPTCGE